LDYQDVITYQEDTVKVITTEQKESYSDDRLLTIIVALRKGPMTVRDLEEEYNKIIEKQIDKMDLTKKEKQELIEKSKRKGKTLYKYLDLLMKNGLVVEAGRRIRPGQTATETLYGRTAKLFVFGGSEKFTQFETNEVWEVIGKIICKERKKSNVDIECFIQKLRTIHKYIQDARVETFTKYSIELSEISTKISHESLANIAMILEIFYIIDSTSKFEKELDECFK